MGTLLAGERKVDWNSKEIYMVDPFFVVVDNTLRGRWAPLTERDILNKAISMYKYGQINPCQVRLVEKDGRKNVPVANSGFTRIAAGRKLREGFVVPNDWSDAELLVEDSEAKVDIIKPGDTIQVPNFMLSITAVRCDENRAFELNLIENLDRNDTTDIDDAHNQNILREKLHYSDADIARFYRYNNQTRVARLKLLLQLPEKYQMLVHNGKLATNAAIDLLDRPQSEWDAIIDASQRDNGKVSGSTVRQMVREKTIEESHDPEKVVEVKPNPPRSKARSVADLRKYLENRIPGTRQEWAVDPSITIFMQVLHGWILGKRNDESLDLAFDDLLKASPDPKFEKDE